MPKTPNGFPFTIEDNKGDRDIILINDSSDETIEIIVKPACPAEDSSTEDDHDNHKDENETHSDCDCDGSNSDDNCTSEEEDGDDSVEEDEDKDKPPYLPMTVTVAKENGSRFVRFELSASMDEINVKRMSVQESDSEVEFSGPSFE